MEKVRSLPEDTLTQKISVLVRREVEARILAPIIRDLGVRFGEDGVKDILHSTIIEIARRQGADLAKSMGGNTAVHFLDSLQYWMKDNALTIDILRDRDNELHFNVTRCRYAEMYRSLDIADMGALFSCNRDFALISGFNPGATLHRTQTIMDNADHCDFRYSFPKTFRDVH